jgi:uncharacterized protein
MRILVLCDDYWHPAEVAQEGLAKLADDGLTFDVIEDAGAFQPERLSDYPVVMLVKSDNTTAEDKTSWANDAVQEALVAYVEGGGGLLVVHSGTASLRNLPALRALVGGAFTHHPPRCPVTVEPAEGHPLTVGVEAFTAEDEHYMMVLDDANADVFLTSVSEDGSQPAGWTRDQGAGRVCVLTPGHTVEVWVHPSFQTLLRNALAWCGGEA